MVCFQRVWSLAIETLERALSLAAGRQRQDQILPALGASWSFSLAHAIFLKPGNSNCLFGPGPERANIFAALWNVVERPQKDHSTERLSERGRSPRRAPVARTRSAGLIHRFWPEKVLLQPIKESRIFCVGGKIMTELSTCVPRGLYRL
jgi:hypothetical protein